MVGDARVRALQAVPDADVAQHVVRQRPQEPHRIDGRAARGRRRPGRPRPRPSAGNNRTGSEVAAPEPTKTPVRSLNAAAAASARAVAMRDDARSSIARPAAYRPNRSVRRMSLCSLRSSTSAPVEIGDLAGDRARPIGRVPLARWARARIGRAHASKISVRRACRRADGAGSGTTTHPRLRSPRRPSSDRRNTRQLFEPPKPNEFDSAIRTGARAVHRARG